MAACHRPARPSDTRTREEFERGAVLRAAADAERPPPVSLWWVLLPPAYFVLRKRRDDTYRRRVAEAMSTKDREALGHLRDVASAWAFVATGGALIAVEATWNLRENYRWPEWTFWAASATMLLIAFVRTAQQIRRRRARSSNTAPSASASH